MALGKPVLTHQQLTDHITTVGNISDVIYAPLYDAVTYASAGQSTLSFFSVPVGQGTTSAPSATGPKSLADTNMTAAGQLTKGNDFYMTGQELQFYPGVSPGVGSEAATAIGSFVNDCYVFSKAGVLTLQIGSNRNYIQDGPAGIFPSLTRLAVAATLAGGTTLNNQEISYAVLSGQPYTITPVYIEATQGFQETLFYPANVPLPSGQPGRVISRLQGYLIRNAQ